jgi:hypothetical protein
MAFSTRISREGGGSGGGSSGGYHGHHAYDFSRSSNMTIPLSSLAARAEHAVNAPPALPPPRLPLTDPLNSEASAPRHGGGGGGYGSHHSHAPSFSSRWASGGSGYGSMSSSSTSTTTAAGGLDACDFRRREVPSRDEGYHSPSSAPLR